MARKTYTVKQFIKAIPGSGGIVTTIAERVGCDWHTAKKYIDEYVTVQEAYQDECSRVNDLARSTILQSIKSGDTGDAKWWLARKVPDEFADTSKVKHGSDESAPLRIIIEYADPDADPT